MIGSTMSQQAKPNGGCVCVDTLRLPIGVKTGGTVDSLVTAKKLWTSTGWKFGRKLPYLFNVTTPC